MDESHRVGDVPSIYYIPNWLSPQEEEVLLRCIHSGKLSWTQLSNRRLQNLGGLVHPKGLLQTPIPSWLHPCLERCSQTGVFGSGAPNHVLVNSYLPGQGILAHEDGPAYYPGVCIISMGGPAVIHFSPKQDAQQIGRTSLVLQPRSLLIFKDLAYTQYLHSIDEVDAEHLGDNIANLHMHPELEPGSILLRGPERMSLTVRHVEKVVKSLLRLKNS